MGQTMCRLSSLSSLPHWEEELQPWAIRTFGSWVLPSEWSQKQQVVAAKGEMHGMQRWYEGRFKMTPKAVRNAHQDKMRAMSYANTSLWFLARVGSWIFAAKTIRGGLQQVYILFRNNFRILLWNGRIIMIIIVMLHLPSLGHFWKWIDHLRGATSEPFASITLWVAFFAVWQTWALTIRPSWPNDAYWTCKSILGSLVN